MAEFTLVDLEPENEKKKLDDYWFERFLECNQSLDSKFLSRLEKEREFTSHSEIKCDLFCRVSGRSSNVFKLNGCATPMGKLFKEHEIGAQDIFNINKKVFIDEQGKRFCMVFRQRQKKLFNTSNCKPKLVTVIK